MFDSACDLRTADDGAVVMAITNHARAEAAAAAARLAAIAELIKRRTRDDDDEREFWACDTWDATCAEVAAALGLSHRRASTQMYLAVGLDIRLPKVRELLAAGEITAKTASTIAWRTHLVGDPDAMQLIDADIAKSAAGWGSISDAQLDAKIDAVLQERDPDARRAFKAASRSRDVQFGKPEDETGTSSMYGRLYSVHAKLMDRRLAAMIKGVCSDDPRTVGERRSDAMGALLDHATAIPCMCGNPECVGKRTVSTTSPVLIHVIADEAAVAQAQSAPSTPPPASQTPQPPARGAVILGGGVIPPQLLAEMIRGGATFAPLRPPPVKAEKHYRPSSGLIEFVRCRDLTCRFPGCSTPAEACDVDHAIAHPAGPTHPSNLRLLCRKHHLLKTFWTGADGWSDVQKPDGTITWTSPSGHNYVTRPGSRLFFPDWNSATAELPRAATSPPVTNRGLQMPRRKRTRRTERAQRIRSLRNQTQAN